MEKSILDMLLELTTLVHEFNAVSDSKGVQQSLSIVLVRKHLRFVSGMNQVKSQR